MFSKIFSSSDVIKKISSHDQHGVANFSDFISQCVLYMHGKKYTFKSSALVNYTWKVDAVLFNKPVLLYFQHCPFTDMVYDRFPGFVNFDNYVQELCIYYVLRFEILPVLKELAPLVLIKSVKKIHRTSLPQSARVKSGIINDTVLDADNVLMYTFGFNCDVDGAPFIAFALQLSMSVIDKILSTYYTSEMAHVPYIVENFRVQAYRIIGFLHIEHVADLDMNTCKALLVDQLYPNPILYLNGDMGSLYHAQYSKTNITLEKSEPWMENTIYFIDQVYDCQYSDGVSFDLHGFSKQQYVMYNGDILAKCALSKLDTKMVVALIIK